MKRRRRRSKFGKLKKQKFRMGYIAINLLPCITVLGIGAGVVLHTFGAEIRDSYNQWKLESQMLKGNDDAEDQIEELEEDTISVEYNSDLNISSNISEATSTDVEETEEEPIVEEPVIYPEVTSSELLDSGYEFLDIDFDSLKEQNEDVIGWIEIPGTKVNYVVVQGGDNEYYLHHDINGGNSSNGTIFIDSRVDLNLGDDSSSIQYSPIGFYGHHMRSGKMFKAVCNYKQQSYLDNHPFAVYYSPEGVYKLDFFADQYVPGDSDENLYTNQLYDESQFDSFMDNIISNSKISNPDVQVNYGDKVGYLVTCTYEQDNLRYALWYKASKQYTKEIDRQNEYVNVLELTK